MKAAPATGNTCLLLTVVFFNKLVSVWRASVSCFHLFMRSQCVHTNTKSENVVTWNGVINNGGFRFMVVLVLEARWQLTWGSCLEGFFIRWQHFLIHQHWLVWSSDLVKVQKKVFLKRVFVCFCLRAGYSCHTDCSLFIPGRLSEEGKWARADHWWSDVKIRTVLWASPGLPWLGVVLQGCHLLPVSNSSRFI